MSFIVIATQNYVTLVVSESSILIEISSECDGQTIEDIASIIFNISIKNNPEALFIGLKILVLCRNTFVRSVHA